MTEHDRPEPARDAEPGFRLLVVPGVVPASWTRTWAQRLPGVRLELVHDAVAEQEDVLVDGRADAALLRLPVDRDVLHAIPLYTEQTVVVLPKDHLLTALDEVPPAELADETLLMPGDDVLDWGDAPGEPSALPTPPTTADAVELVAAGVGLLVVPQSLARLHHRRDLTYRPLTDAPSSTVALAWLREREGDPMVEELIGIVRGRTANSSRGLGAASGADGLADGGGRAGSDRAAAARGRGTGTRGSAKQSGGGQSGAKQSTGTKGGGTKGTGTKGTGAREQQPGGPWPRRASGAKRSPGRRRGR